MRHDDVYDGSAKRAFLIGREVSSRIKSQEQGTRLLPEISAVRFAARVDISWRGGLTVGFTIGGR